MPGPGRSSGQVVGDDLRYAYDAVQAANRLLVSQLREEKQKNEEEVQGLHLDICSLKQLSQQQAALSQELQGQEGLQHHVLQLEEENWLLPCWRASPSRACPPPTPGHHRSSSASAPAHSLSELLQCLGSFHTTLDRHGLAPSVGHQALCQLLFLISGTTLNCLLLRKDTCSWSCGIQLRCNISQVEQWLWAQGLQQSRSSVRSWSPWSRLPSCCRGRR